VVPGNLPMTITSIDVRMDFSPATGSFQIYRSLVSRPGALLGVSAPLPVVSAGGEAVYSVAFPTNWLQAGQQYWIGPVVTSSGMYLWHKSQSTAPAVATFSLDTWSQVATYPPEIRINAAYAPTPCCAFNGAGCAVVDSDVCSQLGGIMHSESSTCAAVDCPHTLYAACCRGATCEFITVAACAAAPAGRGLAPGTPCSPPSPGGPNVCCGADFNNSGTLQVQDIFDFISAWFAACP
jgi:hypothetical protein